MGDGEGKRGEKKGPWGEISSFKIKNKTEIFADGVVLLFIDRTILPLTQTR